MSEGRAHSGPDPRSGRSATHKAPFTLAALPGDATFGASVDFPSAREPISRVIAAEEAGAALADALDNHHGFLLLRGMQAVSESPQRLVSLSEAFGTEVENYLETLTEPTAVHPQVPEILVVSNVPPTSKAPPAQPEPPLTDTGGVPVQFPHRRGWHTDQSYRRPPPDISLFYAHVPVPAGQGQTLYADGLAAYEALPPDLKQRVETLQGIHAKPGIGRAEYAVRDGRTPDPLAPHQMPQVQPVVRVHPRTGQRALYLCEAGQMDWVDGPFVGMEAGPDGEGARLLYELMSHFTRPEFCYVHEWQAGDLVIYDNRTLIHCATWFDAARHERVMWRTTVWGNPGPEYAGEARSWTARAASGV